MKVCFFLNSLVTFIPLKALSFTFYLVFSEYISLHLVSPQPLVNPSLSHLFLIGNRFFKTSPTAKEPTKIHKQHFSFPWDMTSDLCYPRSEQHRKSDRTTGLSEWDSNGTHNAAGLWLTAVYRFRCHHSSQTKGLPFSTLFKLDGLLVCMHKPLWEYCLRWCWVEWGVCWRLHHSSDMRDVVLEWHVFSRIARLMIRHRELRVSQEWHPYPPSQFHHKAC